MQSVPADIEEVQGLSSPSLINDPNFLQAVSQMATRQEVVAGSAIYASSGLKLLDAGIRIDHRLYERLRLHRLMAPIDQCLKAQHPVDIASLKAMVMLLSESSLLGRQLSSHLGTQQHMVLKVLEHMPWPQQASFKITVMRAQLPQLFEHSVLMMMTAVFLAVKQRLSLNDCAELAAAAMLHDVGMLYMPPSWTNASHKLTAQERKQLAAHSITAMLVVRETGVYSRRAEDAVLEHHERLDGSGYPRHVKAAAISPWGRILMLAEVVSAFYSKFTDMPAQRLSLMLRMNHRRFDDELLKHVHALLTETEVSTTGGVAHTSSEVRQVVATLAAVMKTWEVSKRQLPEAWQSMHGAAAVSYVDMRMQSLEKALAESGSHPLQQADWLKMFEEEPSSMAEMVLINKEALWQVESCVEACIRQWPQLLKPQNPLEVIVEDWLVNCRIVLGLQSPLSDAAQT
ncbi:HD-GYP domain-containing protein [Comamonas sp. NoAH]|uniref:HD-GYP domain-containing protein n=1 Tax=Comamonas halotolerans TaxID=3041496 RepID=UPI0024E055C5|nr:HD domain-containing phosphohydrolase [Comamonas sp. NoAH]